MTRRPPSHSTCRQVIALNTAWLETDRPWLETDAIWLETDAIWPETDPVC